MRVTLPFRVYFPPWILSCTHPILNLYWVRKKTKYLKNASLISECSVCKKRDLILFLFVCSNSPNENRWMFSCAEGRERSCQWSQAHMKLKCAEISPEMKERVGPGPWVSPHSLCQSVSGKIWADLTWLFVERQKKDELIKFAHQLSCHSGVVMGEINFGWISKMWNWYILRIVSCLVEVCTPVCVCFFCFFNATHQVSSIYMENKFEQNKDNHAERGMHMTKSTESQIRIM